MTAPIEPVPGVPASGEVRRRNARTPQELADFGTRFLDLVKAQTEKIEAGDFEGFERLSNERDVLMRTLDRELPPAVIPSIEVSLRQAVELDRRAMALASRLLAETDQELRKVRKGRAALRGYARPGTDLVSRSSLLDLAS